MAGTGIDFPCTIRTIHTPFPSERLANVALRSLSVDQELSAMVKRTFNLVEPVDSKGPEMGKSVLKTEYTATTNRMLRVAVNGFFESLGVIIQIMEELDVDVLHEKGLEDLHGAQGVEQGMTGTTIAGA